MRLFVLFVLCLPGCATATSSADNASSAGGTTGQEGGAGGNESGGAGGADASGGSGGQGGAPCPVDTIICEGTVKKVCDGQGSFKEVTDCSPLICVPAVGCLVCSPGSASCNGDTSTVCNNDGLGYTETLCDPVQGMSCDPSTGHCIGVCAPETLGYSYVGCDYYPTVIANHVGDSYHFAVAVSNSTNNDASIQVTKGAQVIANTLVTANDVTVIQLPWVLSLKAYGPSVLEVDGAYRLRTNQPVTVYQYSPLEYTLTGYPGSFSATNDASLLLPVNVWGQNYRVVSRSHSFLGFPGVYAVTASQDATTIILTPSATGGTVNPGGGVAANGTGTVVLNQGDVLEVSTNSAGGSPDGSDLTGTLIQADKPVQVLGGHGCTFVPHNVPSCDHLEEAMPPIKTLSKEYIVTPPLVPSGGSVPKAQLVRIVATKNATTIAYDPPQSGAPTLIANAGDYGEIGPTDANFMITANAKVLVAQYMQGQGSSSQGEDGDPAMALAVPIDQYRTDYLFHSPTNYVKNYVNVTAPTGETVLLDGVAISGFVAIGSTGFSVTRIELSNAGTGNHTVSGSKAVGVSVYGYGDFTSYWYPGGQDLSPLSR